MREHEDRQAREFPIVSSLGCPCTWIPFLIVAVAILIMMGLLGAAQIYVELMLD